MKQEIASEKRKRALADSLKKLMRDKSFTKVTVSDIIADCGVNRKTFYYHFEDMYALLKWMLEQEAIEVVKQYDLIINYEDAILFAMDYVDENDRMLNNICNSVGRGELKRFFCADFYGIIGSLIDRAAELGGCTVPESFRAFLVRFYTEAVAGVLLDWITDRTTRNREQTVEYISVILSSAIPEVFKTMNDKIGSK